MIKAEIWVKVTILSFHYTQIDLRYRHTYIGFTDMKLDLHTLPVFLFWVACGYSILSSSIENSWNVPRVTWTDLGRL